MGLMLDLIRKHDIRPQQVAKVKVGTNRHMPNALIHHRPKNELQAKFSMEFCMAILLIERGEAGAIHRCRRQSPRRAGDDQKVNFSVHPSRQRVLTGDHDHGRIDGGKVVADRPTSAGQSLNPMTDAGLAEKFSQCAAWGGLDGTTTKAVLDLVWRLEDLPDVSELTKLLRRV
jgi:2-methylcitrate dehydratase PrpD